MRYKSALPFILSLLMLVGNTAYGAHIVVWGYHQAAPAGNDFMKIAGGGESHSLALKSDGSLMAWGDNDYGQCNVPDGNDFIDIACGEYFCLALKSDGSLAAWGRNNKGQCNVPHGNIFKAIGCGYRHGLAIRSNGSIAAWGMNNAGQCNVPSGNNFVAVTGGMLHSLALKANGSLAIWGSTSGWSRRLPSGNDFVAISSGAYHCLALKSNGTLVIWGLDSQGPNGQPWYVPDGNDYVAVASGRFHCLALKSDGSLKAWGENGYGQCVVPNGNDYISVDCGYNHSLALDSSEPKTIYVDQDANGLNDGSSWTDAYNFLQDALRAVETKDEIRIAQGIYMPDCDSANPYGTGNRNATFQIPDDVIIKGGYAGNNEPNPDLRNVSIFKTILSGDLNGDDSSGYKTDNCFRVVRFSYAQRKPVLNGLTITGGYNETYNGKGAGILCGKSNPLIINCNITGNNVNGHFSYGAGIYNDGSSPKLLNCIISRNYAKYNGSAIYSNIYSTPNLVNCTITGHGGSTALHNLNSSVLELTNCIVWNSTRKEFYGPATVNFSNIKGGYLGIGNINANPCFIDSANSNYRLATDSPCINKGDPNFILDPNYPYDIDGKLRIIDGRIDMGAYECNYLLEIIFPQPDAALQDSATLTAEVSYMSDVNAVFFYVREPNDGNGTPIGYEDLPADLNVVSGKWQYSFDTTLLDDGYYVVLAKASDTHVNEIWSDIVPFSIRNWAVMELLPASRHLRAGRTVPLKFALRINETVDPAMPFVYNQELEVRIFDVADPDNILQTSLYGDTAKDYRIDTVGELYIINFKTSKTPATYEIQIWRTNNNFLIGSFTFDTEVLGRSDLNGDGAANYDDLALMVQSWLGSDKIADITPEPSGDDIVDFRDFAAFANHWLMVTSQ